MAQPAPTSPMTSLGFTLGIGETDNVALTDTATQSQTIATAGLDFGVRRTERFLDLNLNGDFSYLDYLQHAYSGQLVGRADGLAVVTLWSERLKWIVQDDFGDSQVDVFTPLTPNNLEHVNVFSTGPNLLLRPWIDTFLEVDARYVLSSYQTSPLDGHRILGSAAFGRDLSPRSSLSLHADLEELRYDNTVVNTDYDRRELYLKYDIQGARTEISADVGVAQAEVTGQWTSTPLLRLDLIRTVSAWSVLTLSAGRDFTDQSDSFSNLRSGAVGGIVVSPVAPSSSTYLSNYASVQWKFSRGRTTFAVTGRWERDTYITQTTGLDATQANIELRLERHLTSVLTAEVFGSILRSRYLNQPFTQDSRLAGAGLTYQPGRKVTFTLHYRYTDQDASGGGTSYQENRVFATVTYRPLL